MNQMSLFGPREEGPDEKPASDRPERLRVLITVKAAPNPSQTYGETVCVAGLSVDLNRRSWIRLYPVNFRDLTSEDRFRKYELVTVDARPARNDQRRESWKPILATLERGAFLKPWQPRRSWIDPYLEDSMCRLHRAARADANSRSLALIRPKDVSGIDIERHPGWSADEQAKIDAYVNQLDLFSTRDRTPLQAPRFRGFYRYRCYEPGCRGHRQGMIDWEFVAYQRNHLAGADARRAAEALADRFFGDLCAQDRDVAFYVGNQAKRAHVFSVLGVYWPPRI